MFPQSVLQPHAPYKPRYISRYFPNVAADAGFPGVRLHDLRHTHATLLLLGGVPVNAVAQRLGHSTPVITLTVCGHVLKRSEEKAVEVAGSLLAGTLPGGRE
jgi:integrase